MRLLLPGFPGKGGNKKEKYSQCRCPGGGLSGAKAEGFRPLGQVFPGIHPSSHEVACMPADVVKTRMQTATSEGAASSALEILREGPRGFYRGFVPAASRQVPVAWLNCPPNMEVRRPCRKPKHFLLERGFLHFHAGLWEVKPFWVEAWYSGDFIKGMPKCAW